MNNALKLSIESLNASISGQEQADLARKKQIEELKHELEEKQKKIGILSAELSEKTLEVEKKSKQIEDFERNHSVLIQENTKLQSEHSQVSV